MAKREGYYNVQVEFGFPGTGEALMMAALEDVTHMFPNVVKRVEVLAQAAYRRWKAYAAGQLALPDGRKLKMWTGTYHDSIEIEHNDPQGGAFVGYTIFSDDPKASWIEYGTQAWDMHKLLETSHKVRETKDGKRYLIIPFRWGTPDTIVVGAYTGRELPQPVYSWWLKRDADQLVHETSEITGTFQQPSLLDPDKSVTRYTYRWGDRLTPTDITELGLDPDSGPGKNMVGMVRMKNTEIPALDGEYMTFRTLSENSPGWQHPGMEAYAPAKAAYDWVMQEADHALREALDMDVQALEQAARDAS